MSVGTAIVLHVREIVLRDPRGMRWRVEVPTRRRERIHGLLGRERLEPGHALLLLGTRSIHTFGVRFPLTVAFLDERFRVIRVRTVRPRRVVLPSHGVRQVLECPTGADIRSGDVLTEWFDRTSGEQGAKEHVDRQGGQGESDRKDQDEPPGPGRERHRFPPSPVGLDDPQELQQHSHTSSSALPAGS